MPSTANMTRCRPSGLGGGSCWSALNAAGARYSVSSSLLWPSRGAHHRDVTPGAVEADGAVSPEAFDLPLASGSLPSSAKNAIAASRSFHSEGGLVRPLNGHVSDVVVPLRPCWRTYRRGASPRRGPSSSDLQELRHFAACCTTRADTSRISGLRRDHFAGVA